MAFRNITELKTKISTQSGVIPIGEWGDKMGLKNYINILYYESLGPILNPRLKDSSGSSPKRFMRQWMRLTKK